ncbi:MAG: hypothetical protein WCL51_05775 [Bacteroidota bacterium]
MATFIDKEWFYDTYTDYGKEFMIDVIDIYLYQFKEKISGIELGIKNKDYELLRIWFMKLKEHIKVFGYPQVLREKLKALKILRERRDFANFEILFIELKELLIIFNADLLEIKNELQDKMEL